MVTLKLCVVLFSVFLAAAIYQDHAGLTKTLKGKVQALSVATHSLDNATADCARNNAELRQDFAVKEAVNDTLQKQNRDQQNTINGCLSQAIKMIGPEPLKITVLTHIKWPDNRIDPGSVKKEQPMSGTDILILVNRPVTCPCDVQLVTDQPLLLPPDFVILGVAQMHISTPQLLQDRVARLHIEDPSILPTRPLLVTAYSKKTIYGVQVTGLR